MRILNFQVDGQTLTKTGDFSNIIRGSKGYLSCKFKFVGDEWEGCNIAAAFENTSGEHAVLVDNEGMCNVPDEVTDSSFFRVKVAGVSAEKKLITNKVFISQR